MEMAKAARKVDARSLEARRLAWAGPVGLDIDYIREEMNSVWV
jgi:hypothetical protein